MHDATADLEPKRRVGVFGGTFDPPHMGHLIVAQDIAEALDLDLVLWVPAGVPPHKDPTEVTSADQRAALVQAAIGQNSRFEIDEQEVRREGPSYTVETLRALHRERPEAVLHLILGADQFEAFDQWREPNEIARLSRLVVMERDGTLPTRTHPAMDVDCDVVSVTRVDISSTAVRQRIRSGRSIAYLVPDAVQRIIEDQGLYTRGS